MYYFFLFFLLYFLCPDIDECTSPNVCIQNAQCSNTVGSYVCQCAVGYSGDGYSNCTGIWITEILLGNLIIKNDHYV